MAERLRLEIAYSVDRVGIRVIAKTYGGIHSPDANIKLTGSLDPEVAIAFAEALREKAAQVRERNAKRAAEEERRHARMSKLPQISWR